MAFGKVLILLAMLAATMVVARIAEEDESLLTGPLASETLEFADEHEEDVFDEKVPQVTVEEVNPMTGKERRSGAAKLYKCLKLSICIRSL